jgi:hypothetical protein
MQRTIKVALAVIAVGTMLSGTAVAGKKSYPQVSVNLSTRTASGALSTARASGDTKQVIGCYVTHTPGTPSVVCSATNANGDHASCAIASTRAGITVGSINPDSYVVFQWDASNNCSYIQVVNSSEYEPKAW